jgi:hypothetical protein
MNYKRFLINEVEKKDILKQYNLLTEEVSADPVSTLVIDKNVQFPAGYWSEKYLTSALGSEVVKIQEYLKQGTDKMYLVSVNIESGESQIPNVDAESGGKPVEPLYLATKRNETIKNYITQQLQSFVDQKLLANVPTFNIDQPKIGATPWVGTPFCSKGSTPEQQRGECVKNYRTGKATTYKSFNNKYLSEQYVRVVIKLEELTGMKKCLDDMTIQVNYTDLSKKHTCNSSIYEIYLNGIKLFRDDGKPYASLNNNGNKVKQYPGLDKYDNDFFKVGGKRYNTFIVTPEIASEVLVKSMSELPKGQKPSFTLSARCINPLGNNDARWGDGCHEGVGNIVLTNGLKQVFNYESATPNAKNETKTLVRFNACGSGKAQ